MTRPTSAVDRGTYIVMSRDAAASHAGEPVGAAGSPKPSPAGSTLAAGAISRGARLDIPLASHERLTADGDRISVRQISPSSQQER